MYDKIYSVVQTVDDFVWSWWMIILLLGTHVFLTLRTGFIQRKTITKGIPLSVSKEEGADGEVSQFGALATALASTIGTGNIIGVGTAIALGGPGAVLWCWLTGVFGIATKYAESLIAVKYRVKTPDGRMQGGAMYALERGLNMKWLGMIFAVFAGFASFGIGCATQVNAIAEVCNTNLGIDPWIIGVVVAVLTAFVIFGGIKSIASVCEKLVPFMALFYVIGCIIILGINHEFLIPTITTICRLAFADKGAVIGGLVGGGLRYAIQYGVARGLFSNESGMGSAPIAAAAARTRNPVRQALVSSTGTFWDTVVVCLMTGLVLVSTMLKNPELLSSVDNGGQLTTMAFSQIPFFGPFILVVGIITFAYSTILGWAYYGERCVEYFAGKFGLIPYRVLYVAVALIAPVLALDLVWLVADILNALMAIPNLIAVLLLSPVIVKETKKYVNNLDAVDDTPIPVVETGIGNGKK
ncbi:sodium:alanine symporter family protein [Mediterraneibacter glycyrrhizinilyticus]|uniref:alanine/glycine:cation symporter family protein n=1 Tax=Mediterraneibacter glycyrrhizinilyticus TaxID=342942 RepID=UPI0019617962|nr:sodium:alanine symporter family protein [Mediterraneibacter glycyrrhizinilyticus]MBM6801988.1 sodium:alanine symporter family protein [Mediterraneibacter glycyrrhizinilyticus]MDM8126095.1 sodium:alanine symporter family protein [Mediterraneibacter glycyrrhizinilyticus]MDM8210454.1 sodium:alanine symporter family protein [Mediterraneibacter glycyrrhizinilyticus]